MNIKEIVYKISEEFEMVEFKHAYRINGIVDVYKYGNNVFVIPEKTHTKVHEKKLFDFVMDKLEMYPKANTFSKKCINGITYKEFKHNVINNKVFNTSEVTAESYHWDLNLDKFGDDDLYFLCHRDRVKIGRSKDPQKRGLELATALSDDFDIYVFKSKGFMENQMHKCFSELRTKREWFEADIRFENFLGKYKPVFTKISNKKTK